MWEYVVYVLLGIIYLLFMRFFNELIVGILFACGYIIVYPVIGIRQFVYDRDKNPLPLVIITLYVCIGIVLYHYFTGAS